MPDALTNASSLLQDFGLDYGLSDISAILLLSFIFCSAVGVFVTIKTRNSFAGLLSFWGCLGILAMINIISWLIIIIPLIIIGSLIMAKRLNNGT